MPAMYRVAIEVKLTDVEFATVGERWRIECFDISVPDDCPEPHNFAVDRARALSTRETRFVDTCRKAG